VWFDLTYPSHFIDHYLSLRNYLRFHALARPSVIAIFNGDDDVIGA
jgi:hypothetical protein